MPKLMFEFVGITFITLSLFILYYSERHLIEIIQVLSIYIAASFRILPSANKIVSFIPILIAALSFLSFQFCSALISLYSVFLDQNFRRFNCSESSQNSDANKFWCLVFGV